MINWPFEITGNKYSRWYNQLIDKARNRGSIDGYTETHHVIPRSLGGDNTKQNLVKLTAREHYVAHALLWKMKLPGVAGSKMAFAFNTFISRMHVNDEHSYTISSRIYESFRIHYANILKSRMTGTGNHFYGKKHSEETRRIIGEKSKLKEFKRGPEHFNYGKPSFTTPEGKERQRAAIIERWNDPVFKTRILEQRKQANLRPEVIAKRKAISDAQRGVKKDPAHTAGMREAASARKGKKWEEIYTPDQVARMHESLKNRVVTPEGKAKQLEGLRKSAQKPKSEEHKRKISESNKKVDRWWTRGENNPNFGKTMSEEHKQALREKMTGRTQSLETIEKRKQTILATSKTCEHCSRFVRFGDYKKWHGDNCKSLSSNTDSQS